MGVCVYHIKRKPRASSKSAQELKDATIAHAHSMRIALERMTQMARDVNADTIAGITFGREGLRFLSDEENSADYDMIQRIVTGDALQSNGHPDNTYQPILTSLSAPDILALRAAGYQVIDTIYACSVFLSARTA